MIGQKLGSYRIEAKLGSGSMGVVYRAVNEANGRQAAVKVVTAELLQKGKAYERFRREADILQQFRHPNIVRFMAVGRYQGTSYFAMEYIAGVTLDILLERRGALPWTEAVDLGIQTCDALHYAHEHGVVHRDLKPSNLMVTEKGQIKLTDFGIAKDLDATALTATGRTLGTAAYMAPEQIRGEIRGMPGISHKTDLYALGVVLFQMLTGEVPFAGKTTVVMMHRHLTEPPPSLGSRVPDIPAELDRLVVRLMAKEPSERPWDAAAVGLALTELRDKQRRGEKVAMAAPSADTHPERLGSIADLGSSSIAGVTTAARRPRKAGKAKAGPRPSFADLEVPWLQTGLMVLALVVLVGLAGYLLWPPSAAYLFRKAEAMMASKERTDWILAEQRYLDELDRRHPDHPYKEQTRAWRDRILLGQAEGRARLLESPGMAAFSRPKPGAETVFLDASRAAAEATGRGQDGEAARTWRALAENLNPDDAEERPWVLLAHQRAEALEKGIAARRRDAASKLDQALNETIDGNIDEADRLRRDVVRRYERYAELADLVDRARAELPPEPTAPPRSGGMTPTETPSTPVVEEKP